VEPRGRRRPGGRARGEPLRRHDEGLDLILSLPTLNWLDFTDDGPHPVAPLEDVLAAAAEAGFTHVGLDDVSAAGRDPEEVAALLGALGLRCTDVGVLRIGADADAERLAALAAATAASTCIAAVYGDIRSAAADLRRAADVLDGAGVRIALEHAAYGGLPTLAAAVQVCEAVGWERCGLLVDSWHVFHAGDDPWSLLTALAPSQIALVHVNDGAAGAAADPVRESRFARLPPGRGGLELTRFVAALDAIGYDGVVSLEVLSAELRSSPLLAAAEELHRAGGAVRSIR
jgi:sugar phosphate isomerase/epimerase